MDVEVVMFGDGWGGGDRANVVVGTKAFRLG